MFEGSKEVGTTGPEWVEGERQELRSEPDRDRDMEAVASTSDFVPGQMTSHWQVSEQWDDVLLVDFNKSHRALGWGAMLSPGLRALLTYSPLNLHPVVST